MPGIAAHSGSDAGAEAFAAGLREEQAALLAFTALLQAEQDALVQGNVGRLEALSAAKAPQIELLTRLGEQRNRFLAAHNLNANAAGMLAWMVGNASLAGAVRKVWRELLAQAEKAQFINAGNGRLIASSLQQNLGKLSALHAAAAPDGVYRADGQLRPLRNARSWSQA